MDWDLSYWGIAYAIFAALTWWLLMSIATATRPKEAKAMLLVTILIVIILAASLWPATSILSLAHVSNKANARRAERERSEDEA